MDLVHQTKDKDGNLTGVWEVAWTWLPHFIATNPDIVKYVAGMMTEKFRGMTIGNGLQQQMNLEVIKLVVAKLPMPGLEEYLLGSLKVRPEEEMS